MLGPWADVAPAWVPLLQLPPPAPGQKRLADAVDKGKGAHQVQAAPGPSRGPRRRRCCIRAIVSAAAVSSPQCTLQRGLTSGAGGRRRHQARVPVPGSGQPDPGGGGRLSGLDGSLQDVAELVPPQVAVHELLGLLLVQRGGLVVAATA